MQLADLQVQEKSLRIYTKKLNYAAYGARQFNKADIKARLQQAIAAVTKK